MLFKLLVVNMCQFSFSSILFLTQFSNDYNFSPVRFQRQSSKSDGNHLKGNFLFTATGSTDEFNILNIDKLRQCVQFIAYDVWAEFDQCGSERATNTLFPFFFSKWNYRFLSKLCQIFTTLHRITLIFGIVDVVIIFFRAFVGQS